MKRKAATAFFSFCGILTLILDAKTALIGASEGITLCIKTVIPSLFPFFLFSLLLTNALSGTKIPVWNGVCRWLDIPDGAESILLTGLLGGYPVGAQGVAQAYRSKQISKADAQRMLAFCNHAGPAFLFGIGTVLFESTGLCWVLWCIHILSALITGKLMPKNLDSSSKTTAPTTLSVPAALRRSIILMAQVCGWVVLFRVMLTFLSQWFLWYFPPTLETIIAGICELTNGCCYLAGIKPVGLRFLLFSVFLGFGGICVTMQTFSLVAESGLSLQSYLPGKLCQTAVSVLLCTACQLLFPSGERYCTPVWLWIVCLIVPILFHLFLKK